MTKRAHTNVRRHAAGSRPRRRGFTMAEMMVAVVIMVVVTAVVAGLFVQVRRMIGITQWAAETRTQLRATISTLADDLQNINDDAYFILLSRDYAWNGMGGKLYPDDVTYNGTLWADRIAFVANGPFTSLQGVSAVTSTVPQASSARVYYGHSLWTHGLVDMAWAEAVVVNSDLRSLNDLWTTPLTSRPASDWWLVRRAVLHVEDLTGDPATEPVNLVTADYTFPQGDQATGNSRADTDTEFQFLRSAMGLYTWDDLTRWFKTQLTTPTADWAALVWAPRVRADATAQDRTSPAPVLNPLLAQSRALLPHAAKVRFQLRLSDGTLVPRLDEANLNPLLRGQLFSETTNPAKITGMNPLYVFGTPTGVWGDQINPVAVNDPISGATIAPVVQFAYLWVGDRSNLMSTADLYPVALRVRIEVYDPQRRTPDPITVDEWLPIRWNAR